MDTIPDLPEEIWREILFQVYWVDIIENRTINKRIGFLTNKKSFWDFYTKKLFHHEFQNFLIYLSSHNYLELLIKILKIDTSRIDLLTLHSLWIRTLEYENRQNEARFIRELGIIGENKIGGIWQYNFSDYTLEGFLH